MFMQHLIAREGMGAKVLQAVESQDACAAADTGPVVLGTC